MIRIKRILALALPALILGAGLSLPATAFAAEITCIQCHAPQPGPLGAPVKDWQGSVHQQNGIACNDCHGGDPTLLSMEAMSPQRGFLGVPAPEAIPDFCGRCHIGVKEDYLASAHGQALGKGGPQCVTCHSNHAIQRASADLINPKDCSRCHTYGRAEEMKKAVVETDQMISRLQTELQGLHRIGIATKEMEGQVFAARNDFHRLFHTVKVEIVRDKTAAVQAKLGEVQKAADAIRLELDQRRIAGAGVVGLLILAGVVLFLIRKTYHDEERGG